MPPEDSVSKSDTWRFVPYRTIVSYMDPVTDTYPFQVINQTLGRVIDPLIKHREELKRSFFFRTLFTVHQKMARYIRLSQVSDILFQTNQQFRRTNRGKSRLDLLKCLIVVSQQVSPLRFLFLFSSRIVVFEKHVWNTSPNRHLWFSLKEHN